MKRLFFPLVVLGLLVLAAACTDNDLPTALDEADIHPATAAAKGGPSGAVDTDSRARIVVDDNLKITSDDLTGLDGTTAYVGDACGVRAKLFYYDPDQSRSGDLVFSPAQSHSNCAGGARALVFRFPDGDYRAAPYITVGKAMQVGAGGSDAWIADKTPTATAYIAPRDTAAYQPLTFSLGKSQCDELVYENVRVDRTSGLGAWRDDPTRAGWGRWEQDVDEVGAWTVASTAGADGTTHAATCYYYAKRGERKQGVTYNMPFHFDVTEILVQ